VGVGPPRPIDDILVTADLKTEDPKPLDLEKIKDVFKEMEELKAKLSQHNSHNGAGNVPVQSASRGSEVVSPPERPREQTQSSAAHPRSGNYKVEEVSIEKFFYMGNKR